MCSKRVVESKFSEAVSWVLIDHGGYCAPARVARMAEAVQRMF